MLAIERIRGAVGMLGLCMCVGSAILSSAAFGQPTGIDPQAESLLKATTTYLADQKQFSVDTRSTIEAVLDSGQKLQSLSLKPRKCTCSARLGSV